MTPTEPATPQTAAGRPRCSWMGSEVSESEELERWAVLDDALHAYDARLEASDTGGRDGDVMLDSGRYDY